MIRLDYGQLNNFACADRESAQLDRPGKCLDDELLLSYSLVSRVVQQAAARSGHRKKDLCVTIAACC
jgi:hypothetical protein